MGGDFGGGEYATPSGTVEAIATTEPVNLGPGGVCSTSTAIGCVDHAGCPGGEHCVVVSPVLSFKHQASFASSGTTNFSARLT